MKPQLFIILLILGIYSCGSSSESKTKDTTSVWEKETVAIRIPNASTEVLSVDELLNYSNDTLSLMRNNIYAEHGYKFKSKRLQEFYSKQKGYQPKHENVEHLLTEIENRNIKTLRIVEGLRQAKHGSLTVSLNGHYLHFKDAFFENHPESTINKVSADWSDTLRNPQLSSTKPSFFTGTNLKNTFVFLAPLDRSDIMIPDWNADLLKFVLTGLEEDQYEVERPVINGEGTFANYMWNLTTVRFDNEYPITIVADNEIITTTIDTWGLDSEHECPGDRPYMRLDSTKLEKYRNFIDPWEDDSFHKKNMDPKFSFGLIDLIGHEQPWAERISIKRSTLEVKSNTGKAYEGIGIDLNSDGIHDLFWYNEPPENEFETHRVTRLYVNIDGNWVLRYIDNFMGCY